MKFRVVLEYDPDTGSYSAVCPELPGCASAGSHPKWRNVRQSYILLHSRPCEVTVTGPPSNKRGRIVGTLG